MSLAPAAIAMAVRGGSDGEDDDDRDAAYEEVGMRMEAVLALDILVAPGVAAALHAACVDPDREIGDAAVDAIVRIGRPADLARWIETAARHPACVDRVLRGIETVTGERPDADGLAEWWRDAAARFEPGRSYLAGAPSSPGVLIEALRGPDVGMAKQDLRARTALRFVLDFFGGDPATPRELERIDQWWTEHGSRFPAGHLHRWGRTYAPGDVE
jgi:hypothetical protein